MLAIDWGPMKQVSWGYLMLRRGAGRGSRTLVSTLGRLHNSRYTIPAGATCRNRTGDLYFTKVPLYQLS